MSKRLAVIMDPIGSIKPYKDTTLALMLAAQRRGWSLHYLELPDLYLRDGRVAASTRPLTVRDDRDHWYDFTGDAVDTAIGDFDMVLMRKDPPFDLEYIYATYWLERAAADGAFIVNRPDSLRDCNEKGFLAWFPQCTAPTLVTRDPARIRAFHAEQGDIVIKPLDGMGGAGVFRIGKDGLNIGAVVETLGEMGRRSLMAQRYLPEILEGDKRILMIGGEPVDYALARIPSVGEVRGNLAAGGRGVVQPLSDRDRWLAAQVGPELKRRGLLFVGLDVIGDYLTEINVTSPTCLREIERETGEDLGARAIRAFEDTMAECC